MNRFLNLHSSSDYLYDQRPYFTGTWERTLIASDHLIPFQFSINDVRQDTTIYSVNTAGSLSDITSKFYGANKITGWTKTGTGSWGSTGAQLNAGTVDTDDYQTSNQFSLTSGDSFYLEFDSSKYTASSDFVVQLKKGAAEIFNINLGGVVRKYYTVVTTGADYTVVITYSGASGSITNNTPTAEKSTIFQSGLYMWYDGDTLSDSVSDIFGLKIVAGSYSYYSDYLEVCDITDKVKFTLSSSYDYGSIKYVGGFEQWLYKDAVITRSPRAEIEITGDKLNGSIVVEKSVSAVRYNVKLKVTESEYEAFIHSLGGTMAITGRDGQTYTPVNVEISDPTWYRSNGIMEYSFIDENNINIWTQNNSAI